MVLLIPFGWRETEAEIGKELYKERQDTQQQGYLTTGETT